MDEKDVKQDIRFNMVAECILVLIGCHWTYSALKDTQTYGLESVFSITVLVMMPVSLGIGILVARLLSSMREKGRLFNPTGWRRRGAVLYVDAGLMLLGFVALIMQVVFFYERHGSLEAWEAWSLDPHRRTPVMLSTTMLRTAAGVSWIVVPGCELMWWLRHGRQIITESKQRTDGRQRCVIARPDPLPRTPLPRFLCTKRCLG